MSAVDEVVELRKTGLSFEDIANRLDISLDTVKRLWAMHKNKQKDPYRVPFVNKTIMKAKKKQPKPIGPKMLFFDIETAPILGYSWGMWQTDIMKIVKDTYILSFAARWAHEDKIEVFGLPDFPRWRKDKTCDHDLVEKLWGYFNEAEIIVAHNGDQFDIKRSNSRFKYHKLNPPSTYKTIDTLKMARRSFKFSSNKLNEIGNFLKFGGKIPHTGLDLWMRCMKGDDPSAWIDMKKYNAHDVELLQDAYYQLRPWSKNHPNMNLYNDTCGCPKCLSTNIHRRGFDYGPNSKRQRFHCEDCGGWFSGGPPIKNDDQSAAA